MRNGWIPGSGKRLTALALLTAMLLSAGASLAACGKNETESGTGTTPGTDSTADTADSSVPDTQPDTEATPWPTQENLNGRTVTVIACDENVPYTYFELPDEMSSDAMNDAIYMRNGRTEEYLNITLALETGDLDGVAKKIQRSVTAGDGNYDIGNIHIVAGAANLVSGGRLLNLLEVDGFDFSHPWWNQSFVETLTLHRNGESRLYLASGDMIVPNARVLVFNKQMMTDLYQDVSLYEEVRSGAWTLDRLGALTAGVTKDMNGDDKLDREDRYAFGDLGNAGVATSFQHAAGMQLLSVDENNDLHFFFDDDKTITLLEKLNNYLYKEYFSRKTVDISTEDFGNGIVLFGTQVLLKLQVLREFDTDFGILPYPKFDEAQKEYYSSTWNGLLCMPKDVKNPEEIALVLEVLNAASLELLTPVYREQLLASRFSRDPESGEMLDIIFGSLVFDFGFCFDNWVCLYSMLGDMLSHDNLNLASTAKERRAKYEKHYRKILDFNEE